MNYIKIAVIALLFISKSAHSQRNIKWTNLFNGKDLNGWKQLNGKAIYSVVNGEIIGTTVLGKPNSFLATDKDYGDFILELELLVDSGMNSGIQFRSLSSAAYNNGRVNGYQMEVDPSKRGWSGGIYDESRRGWLYTLEYNPEAKVAFKNGVWNKYRIEAIGNSLRTWVNGIPTANLSDAETASGFIALQVHALGKDDQPGKQIRWRNIRIQTVGLRPSAPDNIFCANTIPNYLSAQEKANGYTLLFDGTSTTQWRGAYREVFPEKGWEVADGVLSVVKSDGRESANGGDIITKKEYGAFELKFDFMLTEGANSGVKYFVTESEGNKGSTIGLEYQILDDERHPDAKLGINGNRTLGSLYDFITSKKIKAAQKKIGERNQGLIRAYPDNNIEYWLDGYKILDYKRGSAEFLKLVAGSKFKNRPNFGMAAKGHILLQEHGYRVSFRSIKSRN